MNFGIYDPYPLTSIFLGLSKKEGVWKCAVAALAAKFLIATTLLHTRFYTRRAWERDKGESHLEKC